MLPRGATVHVKWLSAPPPAAPLAVPAAHRTPQMAAQGPLKCANELQHGTRKAKQRPYSEVLLGLNQRQDSELLVIT